MKIVQTIFGSGYRLLRFFERTRTDLSKPGRSFVNWHVLKKQNAKRLLAKTDKLHLGCGTVIIENYINVDAVSLPGVDFKCKLHKLYDYFPENSVSEIYICHTLEHFPARLLPLYLKMFYHVLKQKGILRISVPDISKIMAVAQNKDWTDDEIELLQGVIGGGQDHKYNYHKTFFWPEYLKRKLEAVGFKKVQEYPLRPHYTGQDINDSSACAGFNPFGAGLSLNMRGEK